MDNSAIPLTAANENCLDQDKLKSQEVVAKTLDHSPGRTSVKSFKATVAPKASSKSIPKLKDNKSPKSTTKNGNKSQTSLVKNEDRLHTSVIPTKKTPSPVANKSPNTIKSQAKSKIPFMKKSPSSSSNTNSISTAQNVAKKLPPQSGKIPQQKLTAEMKALDIKQQHLMNSKSKTSQSRSSSPQLNKTPSSISKSSFITSSPTVQQKKRIAKNQTARSNSETPVSVANKRSASNISTRSTPCPKSKEMHETNLRKMISTAGDHNKMEKLDSDIKPQEAKNLKELPEELVNDKSAESLNEFKTKINMYMDQWFSPFKEELNVCDKNNLQNIEKFQKKLEELQILQSNDILALIDDMSAVTKDNCDVEMINLKRKLEESNKALRNLEEKYNDLSRQYEEEVGKWERDLKEKSRLDLGEIKELQKKLKMQEKLTKSTIQNVEKEKENLLAEKSSLQEELNTCRESLNNTNAKFQTMEQQLNHLKKELKLKSETIKKFESDLESKKKLEINLKEMSNKLEELEAKVKSKTHNECVEHLKQISELTNKINCLESENQAKLQEKDKLEQELNDLRNVNKKLQQTELKLQDLQKEYEAKANTSELVPDYSKEVQLEFAKFRQSEVEKRREIDKLKVELSKAQFNMCQLEQQIQRDQQLLEVRSDLINSLQSNEKTHRIHIEELFAQVGEKNSTINELNRELQAKSEEFRNLFTTLSAKQMEVANQEHIIKLLEESNERSQMLRVKQEEKIGRMEEELTHLKQTIAIYQTNILSGKNGKHLLFSPVLPPSNVDYNENFYYYASQRKRKRQVDINVKKYEA
ncbi:rho-associated protein kinase 1 [Lucilia sericata]|uniref:rho-associated protein kinase 1 n=1 Tax=Lucilia sericata TaxID=13632 RepID=UPI0018A853A8|nr:rho-associated protein kinase 1 [Lucilia sericata]